jgi:serine/threonine protein kinase
MKPASPERTPPETVASGPGVDPASAPIDFLAPAQQPDEIGRLGPYRILKILGQGGMGVVFKAEDPALDRMCALKTMLPEVAKKPAMKERFLREARAAAKLEHDHIIPIYQVAEDRGVPYIAMPFLTGASLEDWFTQKQRAGAKTPLSEAHILKLGREIAKGLAAAHAKGMIHRDIKPANIWLDASAGGRVKILDFGLARLSEGAGEQNLTQSGAILGTPAYMAPEQAQGLKLDGRADLFSLGVALYRLCTGELPFRGDNPMSVLMALATVEPPPVRALNRAISPALSDLVATLLVKDPAKRMASAREVVQRIQEIERGSASRERQRPEDATIPPVAPPAANAPGSPAAANPFRDLTETTGQVVAPIGAKRKADPRPARSGNKKALLIGVAAVLIVGLVAGGWLLIHNRHGPEAVRVPVPEGGGERVPGVKGDKSSSTLIVPPAAAGRFALRFDFAKKGDRGAVREDRRLRLPTTGPITIEGTVKVNDPGNAGPNPLHFGTSYQFHIGRTGLSYLPLAPGGDPKKQPPTCHLTAQPFLEANRWHHVAAVRDGKEVRLYVDGKLCDKASCSDPLWDGSKIHGDSGRLRIGGMCQGVTIREVRLSTVARYSGAVFTPETRFHPDKDTLALYHMDEGQGREVRDSSANGFDAEIDGFGTPESRTRWVRADGSPAIPGPPVGVGALPPPRWPLAPSKPEDITWLQGLRAVVTVRTGPNREITLKTALPDGPATVVGVDFRDTERFDDAGLKRLASLRDIETLHLVFRGRYYPEFTPEGRDVLRSLVNVRVLSLGRVVPYGTNKERVPFITALPRLEVLDMSSYPGQAYIEEVEQIKTLRDFTLAFSRDSQRVWQGLEKLRALTQLQVPFFPEMYPVDEIPALAKRLPRCRVSYQVDKNGTKAVIEPTAPVPAGVAK